MMERLQAWVQDHKAVVYTVGAVAAVGVVGGVWYVQSQPRPKRRRAKRVEKPDEEKQVPVRDEEESKVVEAEAEAAVTEEQIEGMQADERASMAVKLKADGNKEYGSSRYPQAVTLYTLALQCKQDPVFYSNRAACFHALGEWDRVVEDTTAALAIDPDYVKAFNRRAHALEQKHSYYEALVDYTASAILEDFRNDKGQASVERLLQRVAQTKAGIILQTREKKLPSATFVSAYMDAFRRRPIPESIQQAANGTADWHLLQGLRRIREKTQEGYEAAQEHFRAATEGDCSLPAVALNYTATFKFLCGDSAGAKSDFDRSIEADPKYTQSYVKRASIYMEMGDQVATWRDFSTAAELNPSDADVPYHRGQVHFITGDFTEAAKDYSESIALDKDFIFSHVQLGVTQYKMGSLAPSMATFRRCLKTFSHSPDVFNYYGELLLDQQKYDEALDKFDTAIAKEERRVKQAPKEGKNVLPYINKALAIFQARQDLPAAVELCVKALGLDPGCDVAVATYAQLLLQQGRIEEALAQFEKSAEIARTEGELVNALSYAEAARAQLDITRRYPRLATRLKGM